MTCYKRLWRILISLAFNPIWFLTRARQPRLKRGQSSNLNQLVCKNKNSKNMYSLSRKRQHWPEFKVITLRFHWGLQITCQSSNFKATSNLKKNISWTSVWASSILQILLGLRLKKVLKNGVPNWGISWISWIKSGCTQLRLPNPLVLIL